ncbi:MAG: cytochrome c family protein [Proteobacteria bacterium]|nr:cytochrome c family protein [Pseudomonadota bacterium]MBU1717127.1 cytochrome c family protein [Pseudomonadota bacterium]
MTQVRKKIILLLITLALAGWPAAHCLAESGPESATLDRLANLYEAVNFNHSAHVDITEGNCAECHHHTTGAVPTNPKCLKCHPGGQESDSMACQDCHSAKRFEVAYLTEIESNTQLYHIDKPGLKGAYHQKCMGCHQTTGGPTGCQDCHVRNEKGDEFFHAGNFSPAPVAHNGGH